MNFECEAFGLKGRSSGSIFAQINACMEIGRWPTVIYSSASLLQTFIYAFYYTFDISGSCYIPHKYFFIENATISSTKIIK